MMMKGREGKPAPSADLLVCFPSRAHLTLLPKPICSPARLSEPSKRRHHHHLKKSTTRNGGQASPLLWAKSKPMGTEISEPTSPKVTCAGQIKVRHKTGSCKNWQSVMEEIERIHNNKKHKRRPAWAEALGFKKEIMQFLTCLRSIRFDFRCFGSFPDSAITSDDDEDDDDDRARYQDNQVGAEDIDDNGTSRTVFSKWFMVLQENQSSSGFNKEEKKDINKPYGEEESAPPPPPNALLLMRCRSAPAKSWLEEREKEQEQEQKDQAAVLIMEQEEIKRKKENLVVMKYDNDFYKISSDIAKETWVVGAGGKDPLSRSRSWKR